MSDTETTFDVADFQSEVIEASRSWPVVVDFWAPWCGPCRVLGPVLERLAAEGAGRWRLGKLNTDEHPDLSARYGIRGIPAVKLFVDGNVVDEFVGALPEPAVRDWLRRALPSPNRRRLETARAAVDRGDAPQALPLLEAVLGEEPGNAEARMLLARALAFGEPERAEAEAREAVEGLPAEVQTAEAVGTIAHLHRVHEGREALPDAPVRPAYEEAVGAVFSGDYDRALERFIEVVSRDRSFDDDGARKACIALFTLLGREHPATLARRRQFDRALY